MCGLVGFWHDADRGGAAALCGRMVAEIAHRGPDDEGVWADEANGVSLGHRRLSVLDLSAAGHQPMISAGGRWVMTYNGEIYNHLELRDELESHRAAPEWRGHSDSETLLAAIEAWGVDATLRRCVGMFAVAAWDRRERAMWLARDRMGEKPLYYGWQGRAFLFASELSALRVHPSFNGEIDRGALTLLMRHGYVPSPYSIYAGIKKLPAGTWLQVREGGGAAEPVGYWSLLEVAQRGLAEPLTLNDSEAVDAAASVVSGAVRSQMLADVPLGGLLSGGVDSTLIVALMQTCSSRPVRTFTIGFEERAYDETLHARAVARHLGTEHTEVRLSARDALEMVPHLPTMYAEPFADSSQMPTALVMQLARRHVAVALSGDGGDELFAGYNRYSVAPMVWQRMRMVPAHLRRAFARLLVALPTSIGNRFGMGLGRGLSVAQLGDKLHKLGLRLGDIASVDDLYLSLVSEWPDPASVVIGGHIPPYPIGDRGSWPRIHDPTARMMALDGISYLPDDILVKVDRAAMAVSLETRAPFLDHRLVEFAWRLPMRMKMRDGRGKWVLRQLLDRHLPRTLIERPKQGFGIPLDDWLRGPLRSWAAELLAPERLRREGFFDPEPIVAIWRKHLAQRGAFGQRLWSVLMFQAWLESSRRPRQSPFVHPR